MIGLLMNGWEKRQERVYFNECLKIGFLAGCRHSLFNFYWEGCSQT